MSVPILPNKFVIYDTEYTTWKGAQERDWNAPGEEKELVQLGAIKVSELLEIDSLLLYIKPRINPELSVFFTQLTGVTQEDIDTNGRLFEEAYQTFMEWSEGLSKFSYGSDHTVISLNHELYDTGVDIPEVEFNDVRDVFKAAGVDTSKYMSSTIPRAFGLTPPPNGHDALNDARSILLALQTVYTSR